MRARNGFECLEFLLTFGDKLGWFIYLIWGCFSFINIYWKEWAQPKWRKLIQTASWGGRSSIEDWSRSRRRRRSLTSEWRGMHILIKKTQRNTSLTAITHRSIAYISGKSSCRSAFSLERSCLRGCYIFSYTTFHANCSCRQKASWSDLPSWILLLLLWQLNLILSSITLAWAFLKNIILWLLAWTTFRNSVGVRSSEIISNNCAVWILIFVYPLVSIIIIIIVAYIDFRHRGSLRSGRTFKNEFSMFCFEVAGQQISSKIRFWTEWACIRPMRIDYADETGLLYIKVSPLVVPLVSNRGE